MPELIMATEALAAGTLTRRELTRGYTMVYRNVYVPKGSALTAADRATAAALSRGDHPVLVGLSAAALLGSRWVPDDSPVEVLGVRHRSGNGMIVHAGAVAADEIVYSRGVRCTGVARTAYDLGRRLPFTEGLIRVDALLNATGVPADLMTLPNRYPGARNIRRLRRVLDLADAGAESPQETRVRLILIRGGLPGQGLQTQIRVGNRRVDMGWRKYRVGVEYDGVQHWDDPRQHAGDIGRLEFLDHMGWRIVRVVAEHLRSPRGIVARVQTALRAAGWSP